MSSSMLTTGDDDDGGGDGDEAAVDILRRRCRCMIGRRYTPTSHPPPSPSTSLYPIPHTQHTLPSPPTPHLTFAALVC